jgi:hypothetical protein
MFRRPPISLLVERETHELKGLYSPQPYKMMPAAVDGPIRVKKCRVRKFDRSGKCFGHSLHREPRSLTSRSFPTGVVT